MKILIYKDNLSTGRGADRAVCNLANGLVSHGDTVYLVTCQPKDKPFSCTFDPRVEVTFVPRKQHHGWAKLSAKLHLSDPHGAYAKRLATAIAEIAPDVIIGAGSNELIDLTWATIPSAPIIHQNHIDPTTILKPRQPFRNAHIRKGLRHVRAIQTLLPTQVPIIQQLFADELRPDVIICPIGNSSALSPLPEPLPEEKVILFPAALNADKQQHLLIEAFSRIAADYPDWQVHLYGTGKPDYTQRLKDLIAKHHLQDRILLKGWCSDLTTAYATCAFVAYPSRIEGFPLAILDAAVFSKPVIGFKTTTAIADGIQDLATGLLCDSSLESFTAAIKELIESTSLRKCYGEAAHNAANKKYTPGIILQRWSTLIQQTLTSCTTSN